MLRVADDELFPGPREGDAEQPAFLLGMGRSTVAVLQRQQFVLDAAYKDDGKLQALRRVDRRQGHPRSARYIAR